MTPVRCLDVEWYKHPSGQGDDIWDPAFERRLDAGDLRWVESERCGGKGSTLPCSQVVRKYLQTPYSNCWSMKEFAVGPNAGGPEDEPEDCTGSESCDSSTVDSEPDCPGLLELVGSASRD